MKKIVLSCALLSLLLAAKTKAQTPTAFPASTQYLYIGAAGFSSAPSPTTVGHVDPASCNSALGATFDNLTGITEKINGAGLNILDHFLYGAGVPASGIPTSIKLYRIGENLAVSQVGNLLPPAVPGATFSQINTAAGVVDASDNYIFIAFVYSGSLMSIPFTIANFDVYVGVAPAISTLSNNAVASIPVTYHKLDISDADLQSAFQSFLNNINYMNPVLSEGGFQDIAISPVNGELYTYMSYPAAPGQLVGRPVAINQSTWKAAVVGTTTNTIPGVEMAGAMFDQTGNFNLLFTNQEYYSVDMTSGAITSKGWSNVPSLNGTLRGDLASAISLPRPLPVTLVSFEGYSSTAANTLQWKSAEEKDFKTFELEKSTNGKVFTKLSSIAAKGANSSYEYTDQAPAQMCYYRLKMIDQNLSFKYSSTVTLRSTGNMQTTAIYPTVLTGDKLYIRSLATNLSVVVTDITGRMVQSSCTQTAADTHELSFTRLNAGTYFVTVTNAENNAVLLQQTIIKK